jgi:hypothetical protein
MHLPQSCAPRCRVQASRNHASSPRPWKLRRTWHILEFISVLISADPRADED